MMEAARPSAIRVLLVDDHEVLTDALAMLLASEPDMEIVGTARTVGELVNGAVPDFDVAVMDFLLPDGNGADATRLLKDHHPQIKVVVLSTLVDDLSIVRATRAGADAYIGKEKAASQLVSTIRSLQGGTTESAATARRTRRPRRRAAPRGRNISERELAVLRSLVVGRHTREIAVGLGISPNTVRTHIQNLFSKLGVHSRLEAVALARRERLS